MRRGKEIYSISFRKLYQFLILSSLEIHDTGKPLQKWKDFTHGKLILSLLLFQTLYYVPGSIDFLFIFTFLEQIQESPILNIERGESPIFYLGKPGRSQHFTVLPYHFDQARGIFNKCFMFKSLRARKLWKLNRIHYVSRYCKSIFFVSDGLRMGNFLGGL